MTQASIDPSDVPIGEKKKAVVSYDHTCIAIQNNTDYGYCVKNLFLTLRLPHTCAICHSIRRNGGFVEEPCVTKPRLSNASCYTVILEHTVSTLVF